MAGHNQRNAQKNQSNDGSQKTKGTNVNSKDAQIENLKSVISQLQLDTARLSANVGVLTADTGNLHVQVRQQVKMYAALKKENQTLSQQLQTAKENESMFTVFATPYGCSILIVLIIALTIVALKKGFSVSKGDANISVGDKK
ncbi:MAG: hypothetical protein IKS96_03975 [Fibrobacter sp.]|nr:hypothetical protein [Fibrobacter sp.]